jgi:hypothetical protein
MNRRNFLRSSGAACAGLALTKSIPAFADNSLAGAWRTFEVTTSVELLKPSGVSHIWLPAALIRDTPYQRTLSNKFTAEGGTVKLSQDKQNVLGIVSATYPADRKALLSLTSRVSLKNYAVDLSAPGRAPHVSHAELDYFLRPSRYVPTDGIVKETRSRRPPVRPPTSRRRALFMSGSLTTPSAIRKFGAVGAVTFGPCCSPAIWAANVRT